MAFHCDVPSDASLHCHQHWKPVTPFLTHTHTYAQWLQVEVQPGCGAKLQLCFAASLLQLRGVIAPARVPLVDHTSGDVLCFNGEIFGGLHVAVGHNDGEALKDALASAGGTGSSVNKLDVLAVL